MSDVIDAELETVGSASLPRRIYAYTLPGRAEQKWTRSKGQELIHGLGWIKIGETTRSSVRARLKEQLGTAYPSLEGVQVLLDEGAVRNDGTGFRDHDVHKALQAQGIVRVAGEWFECTVDEVKAAIASLRSGTTFESTRTQDFGMRPEQENAVAMTAGYFRSHTGSKRAPHFLWNAKMRFGKTFTAYQTAREMDWTRVLVLTYKPAVQSAWKEDLLGHVDFEGWHFVDRETPIEYLDSIADGREPLVWFASFQDLGGKDDAGHIKKHNENLYLIDWDCIVVDEYHFGAWRSSARDLYDKADAQLAEIEEPEEEITEEDLNLKAKHYLYLSGTPFRAITNGEFTEDQVFNWTYIDEQREKGNWNVAEGENPYLDLPAIEMYTYRMGREADATADDGEFDGFSLNEYFRAKKVSGGGRDEYVFEDETGVVEFLEMLRGKLSSQMKTKVLTGQKPPFPYEDVRFTEAVRHSVWYLNDVGACYAMKAALEEHVYFRDFVIHVAAGPRAGQGSTAKPPVEEAIRRAERDHRSGTIILSCGKLMTGVTIREWSAIFMLRSLKSPESYFQAAFRVQSPWAIRHPDKPKEILKKASYVFEFDPNRALSLVAEYGTKLATSTNSTSQEVLGELINYLPIFAFDGSQMTKLDANAVLDWAASGIGATALAARWNSPLLVDVTEATLTRLLANPELLDSLEQIEDFRNLRTDVSKVITTTKNLKKAKREQGSKLDGDQKKEQKENASLRKQIREKLQKFVARVPVFMYLTDYREEALKHVIESLDPTLFERVTGLTIGDFRQLSAIGVFNAQNMDFAIYQFRQFESASLRYASTAKEAEAPARVGLWDRSVDANDMLHEM
ncbi:GIY-YIG nuclease family protein [Rathayibacter festucae]|uniref:GIY-YIG nuclease family protein n=1 Tax=Rathayibacter festucae TaxID=110937 RepID=UPI001ABE32C3|nr:GIY-YIG nuclease family protein [Rathayibacter festucae]